MGGTPYPELRGGTKFMISHDFGRRGGGGTENLCFFIFGEAGMLYIFL